jgi:hypothetical protein
MGLRDADLVATWVTKNHYGKTIRKHQRGF